jgi:hypothetical protein
MKASIWKNLKENKKLAQQVKRWQLSSTLEHAEEQGVIDYKTMERVLSNERFKVVSYELEIAKLEKRRNSLKLELAKLQPKPSVASESTEYFETMRDEAFTDLLQCLCLDMQLDEEQLRRAVKAQRQESRLIEVEIANLARRIKQQAKSQPEKKEAVKKQTKVEEEREEKVERTQQRRKSGTTEQLAARAAEISKAEAEEM